MKFFFSFLTIVFLITACQKSVDSNTSNGMPGPPGKDSSGNTGSTMFDSTASDSIILAGDILTYEVITKDSSGWFGIWNDSTGNITSNKLDSVSYGNPNYFASGWKYTFRCPNKPFQALISVDAFSFKKDITVNLYRNGQLIKVSRNNPATGFARLILTAQTDSLKHTPGKSICKYEVLVSDQDTSKFQANGWLGQWNLPDGKINSYNDPLLISGSLAMPSGWSYTFIPDAFPFTMKVGAWPYTQNGALITINFYVDNVLVKTSSSRDIVYAEDFTYVVQ